MQVHPGKKIQLELKDRGWTQRQFAFFLGKKVSEVNELIKGKRNITVQRDILLSHALGTERKYWLDLQNEYDYSLAESDFDLSKLPNFKDQDGLPSTNIDKNSHKISEQNKIQDSGRKITTPEGQEKRIEKKSEEEKKELKVASELDDKLNKEHKIDKDLDISKQDKKHQNSTLQNIEKNSKNLQKIVEDGKKNIPAKQNLSNLDSDSNPTTTSGVGPEGQKNSQEKKDKINRQRIYNETDKFDSYFPKQNKDQKKSTSTKITPLKPDAPTVQEVIEIPQHGNNIHKHKEHIFRKF